MKNEEKALGADAAAVEGAGSIEGSRQDRDWRSWATFVFTDNSLETQALSDAELRALITETDVSYALHAGRQAFTSGRESALREVQTLRESITGMHTGWRSTDPRWREVYQDALARIDRLIATCNQGAPSALGSVPSEAP